MVMRNIPWDLRRRGLKDSIRHDKRVKEAIRKNLKELIAEENIITSDGKKVVKIPLRYLDQYRFRYGTPGTAAGQGKGQEGEIIARDASEVPGGGMPGDLPGSEIYEAEISLEELTNMMLADLALPWFEEKKNHQIKTTTYRYDDIRTKGPMANLDKRRTLLENIKRNAAKRSPKVADLKEDDLRFKVWNVKEELHSNAAIYLLMDRSGCHTAGHMIEMADGSYKYVEDVRIGDEVACIDLQNHTKTSSVVLDTIARRSETLKIYTEDGYSLEASLEHVYFTFDPVTNEIVEKTVTDLKPDDYLISVSQHGRGLKRGKPVHSLTEDEAYFLGYMLGDGSIHLTDEKSYYGNSIFITDENIDRLKTLQTILSGVYGVDSYIKFQTRTRLVIYDTEFARYLKTQFPMVAEKSRNRYIQQDIFYEDERARAAFVSGLFDAEGWVSRHGIHIGNSSLRLLEQLRMMLSFWGIRARLDGNYQEARYIGGRLVKAGEHYVLSIHGQEVKLFAEHIGSRCSKKSSKMNEVCARLGEISGSTTRYVCKTNLRELAGFPTSAKVSGYLYHERFKSNPAPTLQSLRNMVEELDGLQDEMNRELVEKTLQNRLILSKVIRIEYTNAVKPVYDFEVAKHHNYIVNGMLSHNSMTTEKKYIAKSFFFWMVRFLKLKYNNVDLVFIAHDVDARIVPEKDFFIISNSGGTLCSSAYALALENITKIHPKDRWNTYLFHFSDGENQEDDNRKCKELIHHLLLHCTMVGYGEINYQDDASFYGLVKPYSPHWSTLYKELKTIDHARFITTIIKQKEDVHNALQQFFNRREPKKKA